MKRYDQNFKEEALKLSDDIGIKKACEQLNLNYGTLTENMIIPQIADNKTRSGRLEIPKVCPVCGGNATIKEENAVKVLRCENPKCLAKHIKSFTHFMSRDAMNVEGLSEATVEKMINQGYLKELADLFHLNCICKKDTIH